MKQLGQTPEFQPAWHPQLNIEPELFYSDVLQGLAYALGQPEHSALFAGVKEGKTPQEVEQLFHSHKDSLRETTLSKVSETVKQFMNEKDPLEYVIEKWAGNNTVKFAQGKLGAGEVLGEGVCLGLSLRVLQALLENPDLADADLQADQVLPSDRFLQASHVTHMRVGKWRQGWDSMTPAQMENLEWNVPRSYLRKRGLSLKSLEGSVPWEAKSWPWLQAKLMDRPLMQKSGAALLLKFPHHATALQVDPQKGIYRFYDPNFGVYRFENASELVSFMKDLAPVYGENAKFKVLKLQRSS